MSLELKSAEISAIDSLWKTWSGSSDSELEATFKHLDYTNFLNIIKYLRTLGLKEEPQPPKLNILVAGGLRFTLVGSANIERYCNDNVLKGKPFHVILKERKSSDGVSEVDLADYDVRIKVRREHVLSVTDSRVMDACSKWATLPKSFRYIQRYGFTSMHHKGIQFDASFVRENKKDSRGQYIQSTTFTGANINKQPVRYEMEVESLMGATQKSLMVGITLVLRGLQRSYVITRESVKQQVIALMTAQTNVSKGGFPGSQPVTLRKAHIGVEPEANTPNLRIGDYNVTDKADGLRCLLVVAKTGRIYLVDRSLNVYGTDLRLNDADALEWSGAVLDGEWVTQDAESKPISKYFAFDIFNGRRGEDVSSRPFLIRAETAVSRLAALTDAIATFSKAGKIFANIPACHAFSIHMKSFHTPVDTTDPNGIFTMAAAILDRLKVNPPYHTDGLIFTPNNSPLAKNVNTWTQQFKWKPASMNSVDFLVVTEKERGLDGKPTGVDLVGNRLKEETNQMVRHKTLRLFVGSAVDPAFTDPRATILEKRPYPASLDGRGRGDYRPVEFSSMPPDPMASVCYVAMNAGATDAAGAAPASSSLHALDENIYTEEGDIISNRTIVEMVYDPLATAGWRWKPMRVRWDKTEQFSRGEVGGTMNAEFVANDVWASIHDPITEFMIRTGATTEESSAIAGKAAGTGAYYQRRANQRDLYKIRGLQEFHNRFIKEDLLLSRVLRPGAALLDMSVGQAGDIHKWLHGRVGWVLGVDIALTGITENKNGAYSRYLKLMIQRKGSVPPMVFVQGDSSARYADGSAGTTQLDRTLLRTLWGEKDDAAPPLAVDMRGAAAGGFDVATLMFSLHYFFKDRSTLDGLLRNLSETVKVGGFFVGCCFDGHVVSSLLRDVPLGGMKHGTESETDIWTITKNYDDTVLDDTDSGLGKAIDVGFISIGEAYTEYLVSFPYLKERMAEIGFELLNPEELSGMGLQHSTNLFSESHKMARESGRSFPMSHAVSTFSFLNRWFIFRRRSTGSGLAIPVGPAITLPAISSPLEEPVVAGPALTIVEEEIAPIPSGTEPVAENLGLAQATGPAYQFYHKSGAKDELKVGDKYWRRYLSPYTPFRYKDIGNPSIIYPSLEAAIGAAKYQIATNQPALGAQIFSEVGTIHQKTETRIRELGRPASAEESQLFMEEEGNAFRDSQKPAALRKTGAKFDVTAWESARERILNDFVRQRFEGDAKFRKILEAVSAVKGRLVYYTAGGQTEMSGAIKDDGTIDGMNLYGRALLRIVGLAI